MTSLTGTGRAIRRVVIGGIASGALAAGLLTGVAAQTASAQPADPNATEAPTPAADAPKKPCTGDDCKKAEEATPVAAPRGPQKDVLTSLYEEYSIGAGGGQVSNWVKESMQLRALGYRPSKGNLESLENSLKYRPNQTPLVDALKETVAYQRKLQSQQENAIQQPGRFNIGGGPQDGFNPADPNNTGVFIGPNGGIQQPVG